MKRKITRRILSAFAMAVTTIVYGGENGSNDKLDILRLKAKHNVIEAQIELANIYLQGDSKAQASATLWYRRAVLEGSSEAAYRLAKCYDKGIGVEQNDETTIEFLKLAAQKKHKAARFMLAQKYSQRIENNRAVNSETLESSVKNAMDLLNELAGEDYIPALREIAKLYLTQEVLAPNETKVAFKHLMKAVKSEDATSMRILADCFYKGKGCKKDLDKMLYYLKMSAKLGDLQALAKLAFCYENGIGVEPDFESAFKLHRSAAEQGLAISKIKMGDYYVTGEFVEQSLEAAIKWYREADKDNHPLAAYKLALFALQGVGMEINDEFAVKLLSKAANRGYTKAQYNLGLLCAEGRGTPQETAEAFKWFKKAAEQNDTRAQLELAVCYMEGKGTKKNAEAGIEWLKISAQNGNNEARQILALQSN